MSEHNKFCPNCSTFLHPQEKFSDENDEETKESGLYMVCGECSYQEKINYFSAPHFNKEIKTNSKPIRVAEDYIYDVTFARTKTLECINVKCPSKGKDNPEVVLITSDKRPEIAYLCKICKYRWGARC